MQVISVRADGVQTTTSDSLPPMLRMIVKDVAIRANIHNANALSEATGLPYETCRRLWGNTPAMVGIKTIEKLCDVLQVQPGQLFDYERDEKP